jgi:hypothetical protein
VFVGVGNIEFFSPRSCGERADDGDGSVLEKEARDLYGVPIPNQGDEKLAELN